MPDPTKYVRGYSFTDWQEVNPAKPLHAPALDNELEEIEQALGGTIDALKDIRRADGKLKNGTVTFDSLGPAVKAAMRSYELGSTVQEVEDLRDETLAARNETTSAATAAADSATSAAASAVTASASTTFPRTDMALLAYAKPRSNLDVRQDSLSAMDFAGVTGNPGDDQIVGLRRAVTQANSQRRALRLPPGFYDISDTLAGVFKFCAIVGDGMDSAYIRPQFTNKDVLRADAVSERFTFKDFSIVPFSPMALGSCVRFRDTYWGVAENIHIPNNCYEGITIENGAVAYNNFLKGCLINGGRFLYVLGTFGSGDLQNVWMQNCEGAAATDAGLVVGNVGGFFMDQCEFLVCRNSVYVNVVPGKRVAGCRWSKCYFDSSTHNNFVMAVNNGLVYDSVFSDLSVSSTSVEGSCLFMDANQPGSYKQLTFANCSFTNAKEHGAILRNAQDVDFATCNFNCNGTRNSGGLDHGIVIGEGCDGVAVRGGRAGLSGLWPVNRQGYGVSVSVGASNTTVDGVDVRNNTIKGVGIFSTAGTVVKDCRGFRTHKRGVGMIPIGSTTATIAHGLAYTPLKEQVMLTPASSTSTSDSPRIWISSADATNIVVGLGGVGPSSYDFFFNYDVRVLDD